MKLLLIALTLTFSGLTLASTCSDLQKAEEKITSAALDCGRLVGSLPAKV